MDLAAGSVWLDARGTQSVGHAERGIARYVSEHTEALLELAPELIGWIGLNPDLPLPEAGGAFERSGKLAWQTSSAGPPEGTPPIYHVMSPFEAELGLDDIWPRWSRSTRLVVSLYDLIPLIMREQYNADWGYWATAWIARLGLMRAAHQVLTISEHTAEDAIEHLRLPENRVTVIGSGVSDRFSSLVSSRHEAAALIATELPNVRPGFLLYVGGVDYRKNLEGALRGYAELPQAMRDRHQFVIVCKLPYHRRVSLRAFALDLGIEPRNLLLTGFVPDRTLAALYTDCELFIFPSLYEGAGLPILEAMTCEAPVAASRASAMPEFLGDPAATFDPADPADIARCIREVLESPGMLDALRESSRREVRVHTWRRVAERTVEGYERALSAPLAGMEVAAN
ncbi:MAG TPA: glycosyltransferase family 1 protein [Solirubrobacterales bacterium]|nr:glycosyltransferase family 1 protein [Solirubrobacterales bacterium]